MFSRIRLLYAPDKTYLHQGGVSVESGQVQGGLAGPVRVIERRSAVQQMLSDGHASLETSPAQRRLSLAILGAQVGTCDECRKVNTRTQ